MIIFDEGNKNDITFTSVYGFFVEPRYKRQPGLRRRRRGGGLFYILRSLDEKDLKTKFISYQFI